MKAKAVIVMILIALVFVCASCDQEAQVYYTVDFFVEEETVATQTVKRGDMIYAADIPSREGFDAYWADENGNLVDFPVHVLSDKNYHAVFTKEKIENAYKIEYYLENGNNSFELDSSRTRFYSVAAGVSVYARIIEIDGYAFDSENADNVLQCVTEKDKSFTLKMYYAKKYFSVKLMANGDLFEEFQAERNGELSVSGIDLPESPVGKRFVYWSKSPDGKRFTGGKVSSDMTLYAVFKDEDWSALAVVLENERYYLIDESGEAWIDNPKFDLLSVEPGFRFVFSIMYKKGVVGVAVVTARHIDEDGNTRVEILTQDNRGYYSVTVDCHTEIEISGLA